MTEELTRRERQVLLLICRGMANKEIARELCITVKTVEWHVTNVLGKLGADNRTQAVVIALEQGLLGPAEL
ncbi:MAG: response regulator transcription factor [Desulfobacterales bacterium]|nr:response regulator transcription factor [Desulfobacterales bacterium]